MWSISLQVVFFDANGCCAWLLQVVLLQLRPHNNDLIQTSMLHAHSRLQNKKEINHRFNFNAFYYSHLNVNFDSKISCRYYLQNKDLFQEIEKENRRNVYKIIYKNIRRGSDRLGIIRILAKTVLYTVNIQ